MTGRYLVWIYTRCNKKPCYWDENRQHGLLK